MLPFTSVQFFEVFGTYNDAIWPVPVVAYGLAAIAIVLLFRPSATGDRLIAAILSAMWLWTGIAYHWFHFAAINPLAYAFGAAFLVQGAIFVHAGIVGRRLRFGPEQRIRVGAGLALILYAAVIYPIIGSALGHAYPRVPTFGVTPCPVTIFTFGCLLLLRAPVKWWVLALPVLWSLIGGSAAFLLDVPQDWALLASGVTTVMLLSLVRPRLLH